VASSDAVGTARLVQSISNALLTHSYRSNVADWEGEHAGFAANSAAMMTAIEMDWRFTNSSP
jgi:hypothetical protein